MKAYQVYASMIGAAIVLLAGSSASEAGWFRSRYTCYDYPAASINSPATRPAPSAAPTHAAAPAPSRSVIVQTADKPATQAEPTEAAPPAATNCAPGTTSGGGWSTAPQSSWDFGRFPPYR